MRMDQQRTNKHTEIIDDVTTYKHVAHTLMVALHPRNLLISGLWGAAMPRAVCLGLLLIAAGERTLHMRCCMAIAVTCLMHHDAA